MDVRRGWLAKWQDMASVGDLGIKTVSFTMTIKSLPQLIINFHGAFFCKMGWGNGWKMMQPAASENNASHAQQLSLVISQPGFFILHHKFCFFMPLMPRTRTKPLSTDCNISTNCLSSIKALSETHTKSFCGAETKNFHQIVCGLRTNVSDDKRATTHCGQNQTLPQKVAPTVPVSKFPRRSQQGFLSKWFYTIVVCDV